MLQEFLNMVSKAEMLGRFEQKDGQICYMGDDIDVIIVTVFTSENGDCVEAVFHKGTEELIDMNTKHVCTCGHCKH